MPEYLTPGVYVEEVGGRVHTIEGVPTTTTAFLGMTERGQVQPTLVTSFAEYATAFGADGGDAIDLAYAVRGFFDNGGRRAYICRTRRGSAADAQDALAALATIDDEISLVCAPGAGPEVGRALIRHCEEVRSRFAILDAPRHLPDDWDPRSELCESAFAAVYTPWLLVADLSDSERQRVVPPSGHMAGIYARVDVNRGVYKAPANEAVKGVSALASEISKVQQDAMNAKGICAIREFAGRGIRVWGARTIAANSEWKYINVRRLVTFVERSIYSGTSWAVFEPNEGRTWNAVRASITAFLFTLWRNGTFVGAKPEEAFFVKCDRETMTQNDLDNGRLICMIGIAPLKPAEFVIIRIGWQVA